MLPRSSRLSLLPVLMAGIGLARPGVATCQDTLALHLPDSSAHSTTSSGERLFGKADVLAFTGAAVATAAIAPFDRTVQRAMQARDVHDVGALHTTANALAFVGGPGPFVGGGLLYVVGRTTNSERAATLGVTLTEGVTFAAVLNGLVKGFSGRELPNATTKDPGDFSFGRGFHDRNGAFVSFPSGHTAASFAAATVVSEEVRVWNPSAASVVTPTAYSLATLVAISRLYQNLHWASDLPLGAAIGVWSGKTVVHWQRHHPSNWLIRQLLDVSIIPSRNRLTITSSSLEAR